MSEIQEKGRKVGLVNLIGMGLGGAIGTGIFVLLGFGIAYTGKSIVLVVAVGCFFMLLAYWYQFFMPSMFILNGGDYSMKQLLFNPLLTGVSAWFTVLGAFAYSSYAVALTSYLIIVIPALASYQTAVAFVIMTLFFLSTIGGSRFLVILENWVTWLLIAAIALFVFFGLPKVDAAAFFSNAGQSGKFFLNGFGGFVSAIAVMGWACQGTTGAINYAAVTDKPKITIPKSILLVNIFLAIIYGLMAYVASGVLPYETVAGANISVTAEAIFPKSVYLFFVVGGGIGAIASSVLGGIGGMRYPLISVAADGWLPAVFKKQTKSGYPYISFICFYIVSVLPIVSGMQLDAIVSLVMIPTMLMNMYLNYACMKLPNRFPEQWERRSMRISKGFFNLCCVLGIAASGVVAYNLFKDLTMRDAIFAVVLCAFLVAMAWIRLKQGAVSQETLDARKQAVIDEALKSE